MSKAKKAPTKTVSWWTDSQGVKWRREGEDTVVSKETPALCASKINKAGGYRIDPFPWTYGSPFQPSNMVEIIKHFWP